MFSGGVAAFLAVVLLDYFLWLPVALRMVTACLFLLGFIGAIMHWIVTPLRTSITSSHVAAKLESHFGHLNDRLTSTVSFLSSDCMGSDEMVQKVIENTDAAVIDLPLESVLAMKPIVIRVASLVLLMSVMAAIAIASPNWMRTGVCRYLYPLGEFEWPRQVAIEPLTGSRTVPIGESVEVRMAVRRGLTSDLRAVVRLRDAGGHETVQAMQQSDAGEFFATVDVVTRDLEYWFEAGDADTRRNVSSIRVVRRPAVVEVRATVSPPSYSSTQTTRVHDLAEGSVLVPVGGKVKFDVRTSKPIDVDGEDGSHLEFAGVGPLPLVAVSTDAVLYSAEIDISKDAEFRVVLRDQQGLQNVGGATYILKAVTDQAPKAAIVEPASGMEVTQRGSVNFQMRIQDDHGLEELDLICERRQTGDVLTFSMKDYIRFTDDADKVVAIAEYDMALAELDLPPGELLSCSAVATDNCPAHLNGPNVGRSIAVRIRVLSDLEFDTHVRDELAILEGRIRELLLEEVDVQRRTQESLDAVTESKAVSRDVRGSSTSLSNRQARLVQRAGEVSGGFQRLFNRLRANAGNANGSIEPVEELRRIFKNVAREHMPSASLSLTKAAQSRDHSEFAAASENAIEHEGLAIAGLREMLKVLAGWGSFQGLVAKTRDLLDRQEELRIRTASVGQEMLGKTVENLTDNEKHLLQRTQAQQEQLAKDLARLLSHMGDLQAEARSGRDKDKASAETIDAALRAARSQRATIRLRDAAEAIGQNRTAAARIHQKRASDALRKMVQALRNRDQRELERLSKKVLKLEVQLAELIEDQQSLRFATQEAHSNTASSADLTTEQRRLRKNTEFLSRDVEELERMESVAMLVRSAGKAMRDAESQLDVGGFKAALMAQDQAIERLLDAQAKLDQFAKEMDRKLLQKHLADIRESLQSILAGQKVVNEQLGELQKAVNDRGRVGRAEARISTKLSRKQADVRETLSELLPDLEKVVVYQWALNRVDVWMETSQQWLLARKIDEELVSTTDRIVHEIEMLVAAIEETQDLPFDEKFAEAEQSGGGTGSGSQSGQKPIPTVAELFVLRSMQVDINGRTSTLHKELDLDEATEQELHQLKALSEDQNQVRQLTQKITARARGNR